MSRWQTALLVAVAVALVSYLAATTLAETLAGASTVQIVGHAGMLLVLVVVYAAAWRLMPSGMLRDGGENR